MSIFKLTIADTDIAKRTQQYKNLLAFQNAFLISFGVALVTGLWYWLVSHEINWNASQLVLILHLAGGGICLLLFPVYFLLHQKDKQQRWWWLVLPWSVKRTEDESAQHLQQRRLGHMVTWLMLVILLSGLIIALPGLLFYTGHIWLQGYGNFQWLALLHTIATLALSPLLLIHILWLTRKLK